MENDIFLGIGNYEKYYLVLILKQIKIDYLTECKKYNLANKLNVI